LENNSATSTTSAIRTRRESGASGCGSVAAKVLAAICGLYQIPIRPRMTIARNAIDENQAMLDWPNGTTINAASSGPIEEPKLPPT
jgi:hypothetical protein